MDRGGGRSSSRLRDRLARMFRPAALLRSTCNTTTASGGAACSSSASSSPAAAGPPASSNNHPPPPPSACSSSRALLAADKDYSSSFLASSRRDLAARTESFSTAVDRLHRRAPSLPLSRFSVDAPPQQPTTLAGREKEKSPRDVCYAVNRHRLGDASCKNDDGGGVRMKLLSTNPYGFSSSDDDTDVVFSSEDAAEDLARRGGSGNKKKKAIAVGGESAAETFFCSSRSFSSDSSEFYTNNKKKKKKKSPCSAAAAAAAPASASSNKKPPIRRHGHCQRRQYYRRGGSCGDTCGVRDGFRPVVVSSASEEQERKGFAVVKRSRDPYADFRASMVDMIVGRQLVGAHDDMERLLRSYLSLNAPRHHPVILQAFSDIWVLLHHAG